MSNAGEEESERVLEARVEKLEERNSEKIEAINSALDALEDTSKSRERRIAWAKKHLEPFDLREDDGDAYRADGGEDVNQYRVRIWKGRNPDGEDYQGDPDEVVEVDEETPFVWQDDPRYHSPPIGIDVHPEDCPATLKVYTSDSVRSPPGIDNHVETAYWDGPMEQGLPYPEDHDSPPFGCEVWGRVMFFVEEGMTR